MAHEITTIRRTARAVLVVCFLVGIFLPLADSVLGFAPANELTEKRLPAARPGTPRSIEDARAFPKRFESWYDDHFGFRGTLIRTHNVLKAKGLRMAPSDDVVIGREGWLYMGIQGAIDQYRAVHPMSPKLLRAWQRRLEECHEYCADRGASFLFVLAPNKVTIYPEYLPSSVTKVGEETRLDQFLRHMEGHSYVQPLDLRPALLAAKERELVYRLHDGHWNEVGAFVAYRRMAEELQKGHPAIPLLDEDEFVRETKLIPGGDITSLMGIPDLYEEEVVYLRTRVPFSYHEVTAGLVAPSIPWEANNEDRLMAGLRTAPFGSEQDDPTLPRLVMFRDSFATNVLANMSTGFSRAVYYWQYFFDPEIIISEGPDIVVQQIVERILMRDRLPPNPPKVRIDFERRRRFQASEDVLFSSPLGAASATHQLPVFESTEGRAALLRLAVDASAAAECVVSSVANDAPQASGTELARRSVAAGLEVVYFDLPPTAPGHHLRVTIEGARELQAVSLEVRDVPTPAE